MSAPRMNVAVFGTSTAGWDLASQMSSAGHTVEKVQDTAEIRNYQALIIAVGESGLERAVNMIAGSVRRGQIVIHTCLARGVQVLDEIETSGAVVVAMAPVGRDRWAVTTADELGSTVAELILGEMGCVGIEKTDAERGPLAARLAYALMAKNIAEDALHELQLLMGDGTSLAMEVDKTETTAAYKYITEPGLRRAFVETARRYAELVDDASLEIWAFQEENR